MDHDPEKNRPASANRNDSIKGHENVYAEKADVIDYKADAILAENAEHDMTVMQAVKAYPMASFWAFIMSCTIVCCLFATSHTSLTLLSDHGVL